MSELLVLEVGQIVQALHQRVGTAVQAAYLYGSVARGVPSARDLDLLLVVASSDQATLFAAIADIQSRHRMLIHPTVVNSRELHSNPLLRELVDSGTVLWQRLE